MTTRADVIAEAREWMGTPWAHQQSCKGVGVDCIGLIAGVARELGIEGAAGFDTDPLIKGYSRSPDVGMVLGACERHLDPCDDPGPGDILYLRVHGTALPQHFAIVTYDGYMIHAKLERKVVENRIDDIWRSRIVRAYSYRGIA